MMNRHERRAARAVNDYAIRKLGISVQYRDRARDALADAEDMVRAYRLAGRATIAMEIRLDALRSALAAAEADLDVARAVVAARDAEIDAATIAATIDHHLNEIGLDALPY